MISQKESNQFFEKKKTFSGASKWVLSPHVSLTENKLLLNKKSYENSGSKRCWPHSSLRFLSVVLRTLSISDDGSKPLVCSRIDLDNDETTTEDFDDNTSSEPEIDLDVKVSYLVYQCKTSFAFYWFI